MTATDPKLRAKLFLWAKSIGLTDQDRHDLTVGILGVEGLSWGALTDAEAWRLLDAMEGSHLVDHLRTNRVERDDTPLNSGPVGGVAVTFDGDRAYAFRFVGMQRVHDDPVNASLYTIPLGSGFARLTVTPQEQWLEGLAEVAEGWTPKQGQIPQFLNGT